RLSPGRGPSVFHLSPAQSYSGAGLPVAHQTELVSGSYEPAIQPPPPPVFQESPPQVWRASDGVPSFPPTVKNSHTLAPVLALTPKIGPRYGHSPPCEP